MAPHHEFLSGKPLRERRLSYVQAGSPPAADIVRLKNPTNIESNYMKNLSTGLKTSLAAVGIAALAGCSMMGMSHDTASYSAKLSGASEVPPNMSSGTGMVEAKLNKKSRTLKWTVTYSGLTGAATAGHFHGPAMAGANAAVAVPFKGSVASPITGEATLTEAQVQELMAGKWYANIHTAAHPGGEIRGQLTPSM